MRHIIHLLMLDYVLSSFLKHHRSGFACFLKLASVAQTTFLFLPIDLNCINRARRVYGWPGLCFRTSLLANRAPASNKTTAENTSLAWPDPFSPRRLSIRDYKRRAALHMMCDLSNFLTGVRFLCQLTMHQNTLYYVLPVNINVNNTYKYLVAFAYCD